MMSDSVSPDELDRLLLADGTLKLLDVRRPSDRSNDPSTIQGAVWKDPEKVAVWGKELAGQNVVIFCVRGGSVSRTVQLKLREQGIPVRCLEGGLEAWKQVRREKMKRSPDL